MSDSRNTPTTPAGLLPHVLVISNHWEARKQCLPAGIFVDRQLSSLRKVGVRISTFDVGTSHSPVHIFKKWLELRSLVRRITPDLIHGRYGTIVGFVAAFAGRPAVITFCGSDLLPGPSVSFVRLRLGFLLSNLAALRAQCLICVSEELRQALWWRKSRAVVIPDGVDLDLFSPGPQDEARRELGWDLKNPIAVFNVGSDANLKGLDLVEAAMKVVRSRVPQAELQIISNVEPIRMPLYYRAADVLLCASKAEGSPNVVKEALACNLPVVSTPVGDVSERLTGVHPSAVVQRDANAIGEAVTQIFFTRKRSNGREHIAQFGLHQVARRVLGVYQSALGHFKDYHSPLGRPAKSADNLDVITIVTITEGEMLGAVVKLHFEAFAGYLNICLGTRYITTFINWFIHAEQAIAIAAVDSHQEVIGYAIGAPLDYHRALNRELFWIVVIQVLMRPSLLFEVRFWNKVRARLRSLLGRPQAQHAGLGLPEPTMSLVAIAVAPSARRKGVGLRLMQAFDARAAELGMRSLLLSVYSNSAGARHFYEMCGWRSGIVGVGNRGELKYFRLVSKKVSSVCRSSELPESAVTRRS
jgi:teichuronic acid biosynthesis glycosyltransferase TuaC